MRKLLMSWALCVVALSAGAHGAADAHGQPAKHEVRSGWINTANAGTAEPELRQGLSARKQDAAPAPEHHRRAGPAMLVAALAVMSAIALRRLRASDL